MAFVKEFFIGVDVGTQSVRSGLVTTDGSVVKVATLPINTRNPFTEMFEQSSDEIWNLCIKTIKSVLEDINPDSVCGIGFDATCSLVAIDEKLEPLSLSKTGNPELNIILWMDHRAVNEANIVNDTKHEVLKFVGGKISPEMEIPKLLWIKKNMPETWRKAGYFFDLPDFLTWKATDSFQRSLCSLVCKWTYLAGDNVKEGWQDDFFNEIGLSDLAWMNYKKIGNEVLEPGKPCGNGLNKIVAKQLGLRPGTPVSMSIIDAHAGGLGVLSCANQKIDTGNIEQRLAIICGTSTCHMKVNKQLLFTTGVWGPYFSVMVPNYWSSEAGQSAAGALLDHVINSHSASIKLKEQVTKSDHKRYITDLLNQLAFELKEKKKLISVSYLTSNYHVYPDYHGNRSPIANPNLKGMICGLTLSNDEDDLVLQYVATIQSLAYSTKHIISALKKSGHEIKSLLVCGGLSKNSMYVQMHADITGLPVIVPYNSEPVLLGCAILAAHAAKFYKSVESAMSFMCGDGKIITPNIDDFEFHDKKYKTYLTLLQAQEKIKEIMSS